MIILAIDTSCDDTCVSVIKAKSKKPKAKTTSQKSKVNFGILSNVVSSQIKIHQKYGGVYPTLAKREHQRNLPLVLEKALKKAKTERKDINVIAVTVGPGLEPCLWTGVNFAKELAQQWKVPLIPVNHIESHILANFLNNKFQVSSFKFQELFPAVCLVVSGGHTQLILMQGIGRYKIIGETRDDAAGECFDKTARILGLSYPGGPAIADAAAKLQTNNRKLPTTPEGVVSRPYGASNYKLPTKLPRPMFNSKDYDFSFSGLKTAVLYQYQKGTSSVCGRAKSKNQKYKQVMAKEIQQAVIDVLIHKTLRAAKEYKAKTIILGGGVAANNELRKQFQEKIQKEIPDSKFYIPDSKLCTDNAAMVGAAGYFNQKNKKRWKQLRANANLRV